MKQRCRREDRIESPKSVSVETSSSRPRDKVQRRQDLLGREETVAIMPRKTASIAAAPCAVRQALCCRRRSASSQVRSIVSTSPQTKD